MKADHNHRSFKEESVMNKNSAWSIVQSVFTAIEFAAVFMMAAVIVVFGIM